MRSLSSFNRGAKYLLCAIDVSPNMLRLNLYWKKRVKTVLHGFIERVKTVLHGFIEIVNEFKRKSSKLCFDQGRGFYNSSMEKSLDDNGVLMHLTHS